MLSIQPFISKLRKNSGLFDTFFLLGFLPHVACQSILAFTFEMGKKWWIEYPERILIKAPTSGGNDIGKWDKHEQAHAMYSRHSKALLAQNTWWHWNWMSEKASVGVNSSKWYTSECVVLYIVSVGCIALVYEIHPNGNVNFFSARDFQSKNTIVFSSFFKIFYPFYSHFLSTINIYSSIFFISLFALTQSSLSSVKLKQMHLTAQLNRY